MASAGHRPVSFDITTPDVALAGLRVVRVVVPGLYPNAPTAFAYLGGGRQFDVPVEQGWLCQARASDELILTPIPHT